MPDLRVNTDLVIKTAGTLGTINDRINTEFETSEKAVTNLEQTWSGPAADRAQTKFNLIRKLCKEDRYNVMDNYQKFLLSVVGEGYTATEEQNLNLADQFK